MIRRAFSLGALLLLAGAVVLASPSPSQAQYRGYRGGGVSIGFGNYGGYRGGYGGYGGGYGFRNYGWGYPGYGYGYPYGRSGLSISFGNSGYGYPYSGFGGYGYGYPYGRSGISIGIGSGYYGGGYGGYGYPYYGGTPYYSSYGYSGTVPYVASSPAYVTGDVVAAGPTMSYAAAPATTQSFYQPGGDVASSDTSAHVIVEAPPDAKIWFDGEPTTSTGPRRQFDSPPLQPGRQYNYEVRATWNEGDREMSQTKSVPVTAGSRVEVRFPDPAQSGAGKADDK